MDRNATKGSNRVAQPREKRREGMRNIVSAALILVFIPAVIAVGLTQWDNRRYYIVSMLIILLSMVPFVLVFEKRRPKARELVLIAVMTAIAVAGRAAFYLVPQFKPIAAIVIITGVSLGSEAGFLTGALTAFVSNMFFGQGPWTPWQMFALGILGFLSGLIFRKEIKTKFQLIMLCVYGAFVTFAVYGVIADTSSFFMNGSQPTWAALLSVYASGVVFNAIHAASTFVFLFVLTKPFLNKIKRIKIKYGLNE